MKKKICFFCCLFFALVALPVEKVYARQRSMDRVPRFILSNPEPYFLPQNHPVRPVLDSIFSKPHIMKNEETLKAAGFLIFSKQGHSGTCVVEHPLLPGYLVKLILNSTSFYRNSSYLTKKECLIKRCVGASLIRQVIQQYHVRYFGVPDKWLYKVFDQEESNAYVLLVTKFPLVSKKETMAAWKMKITLEHLRELFFILKSGAGSTAFAVNVPYSENGMFCFIDTEYFGRNLLARPIERHLSKLMRKEWLCLVQGYRGHEL